MFPDFPDAEEDIKGIQFDTEDIEFSAPDTQKLTDWIRTIIDRENCVLENINYIFCSDDYLHKINVEHLNHDTYTDIITFPYAPPPTVESDIFISIDRVRANAKTFEVSFQKEFLRVVIHGVLHLCGYGDKTDAEAKIMRRKEEEAINIYEENTLR